MTIDYLKLCYFNNPIQYYIEDWKGEKKPYTGHLSKQYLDTFYDVNTGFYVINEKLSLLNITDTEKTTTESYTFNVFFYNVIIGKLFTDSINPDYSFFKFENSLFYDSYYPLTFINKLLESTFNLTFRHITGFDLAIDSEFNIFSKLSPIVYRCETNSYFLNLHKVDLVDQLKYAKNIKPMWKQSQNSKVNQIESTIYIGNKKTTGKETRIYNKSEYSRSYQKQFFNKNFNTSIYRIEVSLSKPLGYNISEKVDFFKLDDQQYLNDLAIQLLIPVLKFKNIKTGKIVNLLNKLRIEDPVKFQLNDCIENIINNYTTIEDPVKPVRSINVNKMQFKKAVKECLKNELPVNRVIDLVLSNDLSKTAIVNEVEDLEKNKNIALRVIHSIVEKEIILTDLTIYNKLIQEIVAIEIPDPKDLTLILKELYNEAQNI